MSLISFGLVDVGGICVACLAGRGIVDPGDGAAYGTLDSGTHGTNGFACLFKSLLLTSRSLAGDGCLASDGEPFASVEFS